MRLYYRICQQEEALSFTKRWQDKSKVEILKKCWVSINQSIMPEDKMILIEDQCSEELVKWFKDACKTQHLEIRHIDKHPKDEYPHYLLLIELLDYWTNLEPDEVHFICNDDYLYLMPFM